MLLGKYATYGEDIAISRIARSCFSNKAIGDIVIPKNIKSIETGTFSNCFNIGKVYIESKELYNVLTSNLACGGLLDMVNEVYILSSIDDGSNAHLSNEDNFTVSQSEINGKLYNLYKSSCLNVEVTTEELKQYISSGDIHLSEGSVTEVLDCKYYSSLLISAR